MTNPYADAIDALALLADGLRKRSRYKRYSEGMRRAFGNRAVGIEKAIAVLRAMATDDRLETEYGLRINQDITQAVGQFPDTATIA